MQQNNSSTTILVKHKKPAVNAIFLAAFMLLSVVLTLLDHNGVKLRQITENYSLMFYLAFVCYCAVGYNAFTVITAFYIKVKKGTPGETTMLAVFYKGMAYIAIIIGVAMVLGKLTAFTTAMSAFAGMMLGWSLQQPVSGIAAWIMVTLSRPYKLGDRITLPNWGIMGDIIKFSPMYMTLNQVGGTVGSEEPSGRIVQVPNAILFGTVIINTTGMQKAEESSYILDEAVFRITFDSDWDVVEKVLLDAAREVTADIIQITGQEPYIRTETWDYGTLFRVRFMTNAVDRPRITHEITKIATKEIQRNRNVDLAIPFVYSFKEQKQKSKQDGQEKTEQLEISKILPGDEPFEAYLERDGFEIEAIMNSIRDKGLLQPIVVKRNANSIDFTIVFGEKRLLACKLLGWEKIPCVVSNKIGASVSQTPHDTHSN
ncbi:MAG: mechanosensitive ion channel [Defluviitaleaceae bacterium]|nr:mechanosensitive ion channel [Defluviitaleaceae bacterium]